MLFRIFQKNNGIINGEVIYRYLKIHVKKSLDEDGEIWQNTFGERVLPIRIPTHIIMNWLGFSEPFSADCLRLRVLAFQDPVIMNYYLAEEQLTKAVSDFDMVDFIFATLLRRLENLRSFENAAILYLEQDLV